MQVFQCHYRERTLLSGLYFDYVKELLHAATQGVGSFPCKPPPCLPHQDSPGKDSHRCSGVCLSDFVACMEVSQEVTKVTNTYHLPYFF